MNEIISTGEHNGKILSDSQPKAGLIMREAMLYEPMAENKVRCNLCNHRCKIQEGRTGICGVRENRAGMLYSLIYGKIIAEHIDPIEKKPLFHFQPGSRAYSIGTVGCNFRCKHCQNYDISQYPHEHEGEIIGQDRTPEQIVAAAKAAGCETIAYTYTEPTIFYEFAQDTAALAQKQGIKKVVPFEELEAVSIEAAKHFTKIPASTLSGIKKLLNYSMKDLADYVEFENQELIHILEPFTWGFNRPIFSGRSH